MDTTIYDRSGRPYTIEFDLPSDSQYLIIKVFTKERRIGFANCIIGQGIMLLQDIHISDAVPIREFRIEKCIRRLLGRKPKMANYRGLGIGTALLKTVLQFARD